MIPINIKNVLKRDIVFPFRLRNQYKSDYKKFLSNSFLIKKNKSFENIKASMTFNSHSLEKGFVHDDFRPGFGTKAINSLIKDIDNYLYNEYPTDDTRFMIAIDVLKKYISIHDSLGLKNDNALKIEKWMSNHQNLNSNGKYGGFFIQNKKSIEKDIEGTFDVFSNSRHSVRNFNGENISEDKIIKSIALASNAPSVCNRQSQKVYQIRNKNKIESVLDIQNGIKGMAKGISDLLVITTDTQYFRSINERNQPYIDGGIFSMNLLYGLHYNNIAACPLNANLTVVGEHSVKDIVGINKSECIVLFIAIGKFKSENKIPLSKREPVSDILVFSKDLESE